MTRLEARHAILPAANRATNRTGFTSRMKHLQSAVSAVRSRRLVGNDVLRDAGFREMA